MKNSRLLAVLLILLAVPAFIFATSEKETSGDKDIKAGFIYIGPTGDYGWTYAHEVGRQYVMEKFPWLESVIVESVDEGDSARFIDRLVQAENCDIVFTTSFGYMDATVEAGAKYPDTIFMHCSGYKQTENVGTYMGDLYQMYYLNGLMAGALTESNKIGYVAAFPIPELFRHINAFAMGIKATNPDARVYVKWLNAWYGPDQAREAAEAFIAEGCDVLAFTEDSPAVVEVGQEHMEAGDTVYTFSHYSPMQAYGEDSVVSGQLIDWGIMYEKTLKDLHDGVWTSEPLWWLAAEKAAKLGGAVDEPINPKFAGALKAITVDTPDLGNISVYDLVMKRYAQMQASPVEFEPYTGPIYDNTGKLQMVEGETPDVAYLESIMYYVDNVVGVIPSE